MNVQAVPRVAIVTGPEPAVVEGELAAAVAARRKAFPDLGLVTIDFSSPTDDPAGLSAVARLRQALEPSLFGDSPIIVALATESADADAIDVLKSVVADGGGPVLIVGHGGGAKGRGVINAGAKSGAQIIKCAKPTESDARGVMRRAAAQAGGTLDPEAEQWLVEAIGINSLGLLLAAVRQAVADSPDGHVTPETVQARFPAQAKISSFKVADHVWAGRSAEAIRLLRGMERRGGQKGVGVSVVAALAHGLRVMALASQTGSAVAARVGVQPWQLDRARENIRRFGWTPRRIARFAALLPGLDADMKGGLEGGQALDDEQKLAVLEQLIVRMTA
ncbi:MAG: hypothetical protein U0904_08365 [Candidatus Nanopelagicales bacterium]|nr:hypothetical protein [Candidatus Nanopelagicales bacterium]